MVAILVDEELLQSNSTYITSITYNLRRNQSAMAGPIVPLATPQKPLILLLCVPSSCCLCTTHAYMDAYWCHKAACLSCIEMVMARYPKLCVPCTRWVDTLACSLSREASFGVDILTLSRELLGLFNQYSEEGDLSEFWYK